MNIRNISQFEDLPVEIFFEIFEYLSIHELYLSFSFLNSHFNSILKSLRNLILITTSHLDPVLFFFKAFSTVQIHINHSNLSSLSQFNFSSFIGIRSFSIYSFVDFDNQIELINLIEKFICPDLCPQLQSLRLPYCSQLLANWIFTGAFPHLKICHLYDICTYKRIILPLTTVNRLQILRQLTIQERNSDEFEKILLLCPNLKYLNFSCHSILPSFVYMNAPYLSLKRLQLSRLKSFLFHNGQLDFFLSLFPNLIHFDLTVEQCRLHDETIDFKKVAHSLHHHLPRLTLLELRIYLTIRNSSSFFRHTFQQISQMHPLFICFGRLETLVHIASYDFTSIHYYSRQFVRQSFK